jgi:hypothetical protein
LHYVSPQGREIGRGQVSLTGFTHNSILRISARKRRFLRAIVFLKLTPVFIPTGSDQSNVTNVLSCTPTSEERRRIASQGGEIIFQDVQTPEYTHPIPQVKAQIWNFRAEGPPKHQVTNVHHLQAVMDRVKTKKAESPEIKSNPIPDTTRSPAAVGVGGPLTRTWSPP